eukprot:TRINITY_DN9002_c0_g2_i3.p1 TRINITY_DN9002_c0_g2~~TRINITY_DN9002_c0_g2_i3.p1  ORF type:complete len:239 (-),score=31.04 TRINITY_DN9002_c0_g2_i3:288-1004(-)
MRFQQGDVVKLGRCSFLVKEVVGESKETALEAKEELKLTQNDIDIEVNEDLNEIKPEEILDNKVHDGILESSKSSEGDAENKEEESGKALSAKSNEIKCRICLGDDSTKENPMISSPCKCLGSIKYIHANCLQHWLKSKVSEHKNSFCYSYCWKEFECDVCKTKYPGNWRNDLRLDYLSCRQLHADSVHTEAQGSLHNSGANQRCPFPQNLHHLPCQARRPQNRKGLRYGRGGATSAR